MALKWADNVIEESATTTTGAYQLAGVPSTGIAPGAQGFVAGIGDTNTCYYYAYEVGGTAWERGLGTVTDAATDTLTRTTIYGSSNGGSAVNWTGKTARIRVVEPARAMYNDHVGMLENAAIVCARASNAETFALKTLAGTDPSPVNPVRIAFAKTDGTFEVVEAVAALSITIPSGATLGALNGVQFKVGVGVINDGGTLRLAVVGRPSGLQDDSLVSSTTIDAAADTARTLYTGTAVTTKRLRILGYATYTLTTAGTWATAPSDVLLTRAGATEILVTEVLYDVTLTSSGAFDTNDVWPGGLPSGYDKFICEEALRSTASAATDATYMLFNNDATNANYSNQFTGGSGATTSSGRTDDPNIATVPGATATADEFGYGIIEIPYPQDTTRLKQASGRFSRRTAASTQRVGLQTQSWESTSAITRIRRFTSSNPTNSFVAGSYFRLYGQRVMTVLT